MNIILRNFLAKYPQTLFKVLAGLALKRRERYYIAGGTVRDVILDRNGYDLDITVAGEGFDCAKEFAKKLDGSFVGLDREEDVARVVWKGIIIDFTGFREGSQTIEEDLRKRDFSINALAVPFKPFWMKQGGIDNFVDVIDPTKGVDDLRRGVIRCTSDSVFKADPLRLLRAYRFMACLHFSIDQSTKKLIRTESSMINRAAVERIAYELELIISSKRAHATMESMHRSGLLGQLFPELLEGIGMAQPASHHLDVFAHSLATLGWMEKIIEDPGRFFPQFDKDLKDYLTVGKRKSWLKWAALFHDLGKPITFRIRENKDGRITFYNHDMTGAKEFRKIAGKFKWGGEDSKQVARLIEMHMWPFHLNNARRKFSLTPKAYLRLIKTAGLELPGLFLLAMADSLAGQGVEKPQTMEESIVSLYSETTRIYRESIKPVLESPRLLNGHDLQEMFGLVPGPIFKKIFLGLEKAQVAGDVRSRIQAIEWVKSFLDQIVK